MRSLFEPQFLRHLFGSRSVPEHPQGAAHPLLLKPDTGRLAKAALQEAAELAFADKAQRGQPGGLIAGPVRQFFPVENRIQSSVHKNNKDPAYYSPGEGWFYHGGAILWQASVSRK